MAVPEKPGREDAYGQDREKQRAGDSRGTLSIGWLSGTGCHVSDKLRSGPRLLEEGQLAAQQLGDLGRRLGAVGRILGVQPDDDGFQPIGDFGIDFADSGRGASSHTRLSTRHRRPGPKGRVTGADGVQHTAEAEEVAAVIEPFAAGLLRRHVGGRAGDEPRLCQAGVIDGAGQAEVGDLDALDAIFEQNVGRLDVTVDETVWRAPPLARRRSAGRCAGPPSPAASPCGRSSLAVSGRR